jgi:hypothetical protein
MYLTIDNLMTATQSVKVDVQVRRPDHLDHLIGRCYYHPVRWLPLCQLSNLFAGSKLARAFILIDATSHIWFYAGCELPRL